ncbi:hypothetical protein [Microlunatus speluncae]|uniref:hypothetical protein n=1 Tax=Microlunatus speluncae TaxID=2594267 RepID=UPI001C2D40C3|nr:hypothetical protein [Microlunatus speluncae]
MRELLIPVAIIGLVIYTIVRRFRGEPLVAKDLVATPLIMIGIGAYSLTKVTGWTGIDLAWLALGIVVGLVFGAIRGGTSGLFVRDGVLHQRYTWPTLTVWILGTAVSFGLGYAGGQLGVHPETRSYPFSIGIGLLGEMITCGLRALRIGHAPVP